MEELIAVFLYSIAGYLYACSVHDPHGATEWERIENTIASLWAAFLWPLILWIKLMGWGLDQASRK